MTQEPQKSNTVLIVIAIIGVVGTIVASVISVIGNYNIEKLRQDTELTRIALVSIATQGGATQIVLERTINAPTQLLEPIDTLVSENTATPVPSATTVPVPTSIPDTLAGTILDLGQTWYQGNKAIRVNNIELSSSDEVALDLNIKNIGAQIVTFELSPENFGVTNNRGQRGGVFFGWVQSPLTLQPGESYSIGGSAPWIEVRGLSVSDQSVTELIISISISNITNAQWRVPIYH